MTQYAWLKNHPHREENVLREQIQRSNLQQEYWKELTSPDTEVVQPSGTQRIPRSRTRFRRLKLLKTGEEVAHSAKWMSDSEWEAVPFPQKQAFTQFLERKLKEAPADVTEQQRRRYYEMTLKDPSLEDPHKNVQDTMQRIRMGLPFSYRANDRMLGVTQAMYESGDASLFDPNNARKIENAMTNVKQLFVDYVNKKKEGISTEAERRQLAKVSADLNYETQKHLANMFKVAEEKVREVIREKRRQQLKQIARMRRALERTKHQGGSKPRASHNKKKSSNSRSGRRKKRLGVRKRAERVLSSTYGLDVAVVKRIIRGIKAQEDFLQMCEVMARMTLGRGFVHSAKDENLDSYTNSLRDVYSVDPSRLAQLDAVQYVAALEKTPPVDWAKRWYESAILVPLQKTPEYQQLEQLQAEELQSAKEAQSQSAEQDAAKPSSDGNSVQSESTPDPLPPAISRKANVLKLVDKMFVPPDSSSLQSLHEGRLRYIAYLHMESQIERMRENAKLFQGVEDTAEAQQCRALYSQLQELKEQAAKASTNPFDDPRVRSIFDEIRGLVRKQIRQRVAASRAGHQAKKARRVLKSLKKGPAAVAKEIDALHKQKKREQIQRMLQLLEKDVREDMLWLANMEEAERPPLLPIPEPMAYVSAADVQQWNALREAREKEAASPFKKDLKKGEFRASFLGQPWQIPAKPMLFWGTGVAAVEQALKNAAEDAERRRTGKKLPPPYPCAENPWGWRLHRDVLDDDT